MRRSLGLGVALAVVIAGCGGGSTDPAGPVFRSERPPTLVADSQGAAIVFRIGGSVVTCRVSSYRASLPRSAERLEVHLRYQGCLLRESEKIGVEAEGCAYVFEPSRPERTAPVQIACKPGAAIRVSVPGACSLEIGSQTPQGGAAYGNTHTGAARSFDLGAELTRISYKASGGPGCPFAAEGDDISANLGIELFGFEDNSGAKGDQVGIWVG